MSGEAGRTLDAEVATRVMGWTLTCPVDDGCDHSVGVHRDGSSAKRNYASDGQREFVLPKFSTEIGDAWLVVAKLCERSSTVRLERRTRFNNWFWVARFVHVEEAQAAAATPSLAICLAALSAADPGVSS